MSKTYVEPSNFEEYAQRFREELKEMFPKKDHKAVDKYVDRQDLRKIYDTNMKIFGHSRINADVYETSMTYPDDICPFEN